MRELCKNNVKLVICDIDWTLLSRQRRVLSEYTMDVFERMRKQGIHFGLASGRPLDEVFPVYSSWKLSFPCDVIICMNGGVIWTQKSNRVDEYYKLKREWIKEIVRNTMPLHVNPYMYYKGGIKSLKYTEEIKQTAIRNNKKLYVAKDIDDFANEDNGKIMIRVKEEEMEALENYLKKFPSNYYQEFKTQSTLLEFTDKRISKGDALVKYCRANNLKQSEIVAFGDTTNDIELMKDSGWGVCLLNGSIDAKLAADAVTEFDVDHDGVGHYVEKYIL